MSVSIVLDEIDTCKCLLNCLDSYWKTINEHNLMMIRLILQMYRAILLDDVILLIYCSVYL